MTISELIERLEALKAEHGDLPIAEWLNVDVRYIAACDDEPACVGVYG